MRARYSTQGLRRECVCAPCTGAQLGQPAAGDNASIGEPMLQRDKVSFFDYNATQARRVVHHPGTAIHDNVQISSNLDYMFCNKQVRNQDAEGYTLLFKVTELWTLLSRQQAFHNWFSKLTLCCIMTCRHRPCLIMFVMRVLDLCEGGTTSQRSLPDRGE